MRISEFASGECEQRQDDRDNNVFGISILKVEHMENIVHKL